MPDERPSQPRTTAPASATFLVSEDTGRLLPGLPGPERVRSWHALIRASSRHDDAFYEALLQATGLSLRVEGLERDAWIAAVASRYKAFAERLIESAPVCDEPALRRVIAAIDEFLAAVSVFGAGVDVGLPEPQPLFATDLATLRAWAEERLAQTTQGSTSGNPLIDGLIRDLLLLYWHGFGRKPSRAPDGPTVRFTDFFLTPIRSWDWSTVCEYASSPPPSDGPLKVLIPLRDAIPDVIQAVMPKVAGAPVPAWWQNLGLKPPSFPG